MRILMPIPSTDFDPTETGVPWSDLVERGHKFVFATPDGTPGKADDVILTGKGLGPLAPFVMANADARDCYSRMTESDEYRSPMRWADVKPSDFDALLLPGGHAPGMKEYLESETLHKLIATAIESKPVAAVCHGVVILARSKRQDGSPVLQGRKVTALLATQEYMAWMLTCLWMGNYFRTYPGLTVEKEVRAALGSQGGFETGPMPIARDTKEVPNGFVVRDGNLVTSRWPGDCHGFAKAFHEILDSNKK